MRKIIGCFLVAGALTAGGCVSIDPRATSYDPNAQSAWQSEPAATPPVYGYKPEGGRTSVPIGSGNVAVGIYQRSETYLAPVGTTTVKKADGTDQTVTIYTGVKTGSTFPR